MVAAVVAILAVCVTGLVGGVIGGAAPSGAAAQVSSEVINVDSSAAPVPCMQVLAHPATLLNSAVVTGSGCDDPLHGSTPVAERLRWSLEGSGVAGRYEFSTDITGHNNLCASENVGTHQVELQICPIYTSTPSKYKNRMWYYRNVTDLDGREASEVVNGQTGLCMAVPFANAVHNDNITTETCAPTSHYLLRQLWYSRIAPGT